jgi:arabinofuranan 3-O-arabinosyltransferase
MLVDGYALGWFVPAGAGGQVTVSYGPQRVLGVGLAITSLALLGALVLLVLRRRRPGPASDPATEPGTTRPARDRPWSRRRLTVAVAVSAITVLVLAGPEVVLVALVVAVAMAPWVDGWTTRAGVAGVVLVALTPFAYLLGNLGRLGAVTPDLVARNVVPNVATGAGLSLVAVAVLVEWLHPRPDGPTADGLADHGDVPVVPESQAVGGAR